MNVGDTVTLITFDRTRGTVLRISPGGVLVHFTKNERERPINIDITYRMSSLRVVVPLSALEAGIGEYLRQELHK